MRKLFAEIRYMDSFWILAFDSYAKHSQQTSWLITVPIGRIISAKNMQAWFSMDFI